MLNEEAAAHTESETLEEWRQGDVALESLPPFLHLADLDRPLSELAQSMAQDISSEPEQGLTVIQSAPRGIVIVTQTCDVVRSWQDRPFIEVSPLIPVTGEILEQVRKLSRPRYAYVPGVAHLGLVADLDLTMTLEKAIVARLTRIPGCRTDQEVREFADALARKRARFAFPDDFVEAFRPIQQRLKQKHNKESPEGRLTQALREIRVRAVPGWDEPKVALSFLFLLEEGEATVTPEHSKQIEAWVGRFIISERFQLSADDPWRLCHLEDLNAREYVDSDRLDLDDLSSSRRSVFKEGTA